MSVKINLYSFMTSLATFYSRRVHIRLASYLFAGFNKKKSLILQKIVNVAFARGTHETKLAYNGCFMPLKIVKVKINQELHKFNS